VKVLGDASDHSGRVAHPVAHLNGCAHAVRRAELVGGGLVDPDALGRFVEPLARRHRDAHGARDAFRAEDDARVGGGPVCARR
jgi:hypothetical protein